MVVIISPEALEHASKIAIRRGRLYALEGEASDLSSASSRRAERFRPIMMTTMRRCSAPCRCWSRPGRIGTARPLGITYVGGLLVSQVLTLYTTP